MCAYAPSSTRTSASSATVARASASLTRRSTRRVGRARPARHAARVHRRLPSGCTSSSASAPSRRAERARRRDRTRRARGRRRRRRRAARASTLHAPAADAQPRARARVPGAHDAVELAAGRARIEPELLDVELVGVRRLAGLRRRRRGRDVGQLLDEQLRCRASTSRARSSPAVSSAPIGVATRRVHRARCRAGFEAHQAHAGLGVAGEDRPLDRRRAAPARQQREVQVHEAERQRLEQRDAGAAGRTRRRRRARRRTRATLVDDSRALSGVRTGSPSSIAACFTGDGSVAVAARPRAGRAA